MRITLTIDDDLAAKLKSRRAGCSFHDMVNETLRGGLATRQATAPREPFRIVARDLGNLKPGLSPDKIGELLDQTEGPIHR